MKKTIIIHPEYTFLKPYIDSIHEEFERGGETIYKDRNEIKIFHWEGIPINVKRFKVPIIINRFAYTYIRPSKAKRSYEYAGILVKKGISTPQPVATIHTYRNGLLHYSYFISLQVDYDQTMYQFGHIPVAGKEHILKAFARFTAALHEKEIYHQDYSPGNILFHETPEGADFCLVDINRIQFGAVSLKKGCANFARLWGKEDFFRLIGIEYARQRKAEEELCIKLILLYRKRFWKKFAMKREIPFKL